MKMFRNAKTGLSMLGESPPTEEKKYIFNTSTGNNWMEQVRAVSWNQTVCIRWSSPDRRRGCERRRRILCNIQWALRGPDRWLILSSSGRYLWRTPPAYPQGSLAPHLVSCLLAADVCSLQEHKKKNKSSVIKILIFLLPKSLRDGSWVPH